MSKLAGRSWSRRLQEERRCPAQKETRRAAWPFALSCRVVPCLALWASRRCQGPTGPGRSPPRTVPGPSAQHRPGPARLCILEPIFRVGIDCISREPKIIIPFTMHSHGFVPQENWRAGFGTLSSYSRDTAALARYAEAPRNDSGHHIQSWSVYHAKGRICVLGSFQLLLSALLPNRQ